MNNCTDVLVLEGSVLIIDPSDATGTNDTMMHSIISKSHVLSVISDSEAKLNDDDDEVSSIVYNTTATEKVPSLNYNFVFNAVKKNYLQNKNYFKIAHINVNSVRHKFEPLLEVLLKSVFDVLTMQ